MQHYEVFYDSLGNVLSSYPHSPEDRAQSFLDLFEEKYAAGLELVSVSVDSSSLYCVFKVVAK